METIKKYWDYFQKFCDKADSILPALINVFKVHVLGRFHFDVASKKTKLALAGISFIILILFLTIQNGRANDVLGYYKAIGTYSYTESILVTKTNSSRSWFTNTVTVNGADYKYSSIVVRNVQVHALSRKGIMWVRMTDK